LSEIKTFKEVTGRKDFEGDQIKWSDLINKEFVVRDFFLLQSSFDPNKDYAMLQIELDGKPYTTTTGSTVIMKQLKEIEEHLPVKVKLRKQKRYYTFE